MGRWIVRGVDAAGRTRTERVQADTAREALAELERGGWRQVELLTDAISASDSTAAVERTRAKVEARVTPAEEIGFRRHGAVWQAWLTFRKGGWVLLALLGWLLWQRFAAPASAGWGTVPWLLLLLAIGIVAYSIWLPGRYKRLVQASAAGRWEDVLRRVAALERSSLGKLIPPAELAFRRASALLGLGREGEALAVLEGIDLTGTPEWAFQARLGDFHARRGQLDEAHACYRRSVELGREHADAHLSFAEFLAGHRVRDTAGAREALARARELPIPANCEWAVERIEGMIAFEEGRFAEALRRLEGSRKALRRMADTGLTPTILAHNGAYAALALAGLGRRDEARATLAASRAEQWLRPSAPELLAWVRATTG